MAMASVMLALGTPAPAFALRDVVNGHCYSLGNRAMRRRMGSAHARLLTVLTIAVLGCDRMQTVSLTAEDFRFTPSLVHVAASSPITLSIYNAGREVHEFDSPVLMYAAAASRPAHTEKEAGAVGILIKPGESVRIAMAPPPGTYLFICRRKGHGDMTGTLIVEPSPSS